MDSNPRCHSVCQLRSSVKLHLTRYDISLNKEKQGRNAGRRLRPYIKEKPPTRGGSVVVCRYLQSVVLPEGVQSIGILTFQGCKNLKSITLPGSLKTIDQVFISAFEIYDNIVYNCPNLEAVNVAQENTSFYSKDGVLMGTDGTLICYPAGKTNTYYTVPSGIKTIGKYAFFRCDALQSIILPEGLESIEGGAFRECKNLKSIGLPRSVQSIGQAFDGTAITAITVSRGCQVPSWGVGKNTDGDEIQVNYR